MNQKERLKELWSHLLDGELMQIISVVVDVLSEDEAKKMADELEGALAELFEALKKLEEK